MENVKNVFSLLDAVIDAKTDEECMGLLLARVARENDNLATSEDLDFAKIVQIRIKSLKTMADLLEQRIKVKNHVSIDPQVASEKILRYLMDKVIESFDQMSLTLDYRNKFMKLLQHHLEEWETVKKTVLADA